MLNDEKEIPATQMSDTEKLMQWIKEGEHEELDFKLTVKSAEKIARNMVAFANRNGGTILIGISDFGEIAGVDPEQEKYVTDRAASEFCVPPLKPRYSVYRSGGLRVLAAYIPKSKTGGHRSIDREGNARFWIRQGDECVSDEERLAAMEAVESKNDPIPIFSEKNKGLIQYLNIHHTITVGQYMQMMDIPFALAKKSLDRLYHAGILQRHGEKGKRNYTLNT